MPTILALLMFAALTPADSPAPEAPTSQDIQRALGIMPLRMLIPPPSVHLHYSQRPGPIGWPPKGWKRRVR